MANNSGTFFNINDNDGIPLVGVSTDGRVLINHLYGNCLIGSTSITGTASQPLQVTGGAYVRDNLGIGITNPSSKLHIVGNILVNGISTLGVTSTTNLTAQNINNSGITTTNSLNIGATQVISSARQLQNIASLDATTTSTIGSAVANLPITFTNLNVSGISTFTNGPVLIGQSSSTGTALQRLQVTGGAYVSGPVGIATTNPLGILQVGSATTTFIITDNGSIGIGNTNPGERLQVDGNMRLGGSTSSNYIAFRGTIADDQIPYNHTFIGERVWSTGTEKSELLIFKGNDADTSTGPDRIRLAGAQIRLDTYTAATSGTFETVATSANVLNRVVVHSTGEVGIGTDALTGTSNQALQVGSSSVVRGAYVSGNLGVGATNPTQKLTVSNNILLGTSVSGSSATPSYIDLGTNYSNGFTRDKLKIYLYNDTISNPTEKYGFGVGGLGDIQYHSNGTHDFYISNTNVVKISGNGNITTPNNIGGGLNIGYKKFVSITGTFSANTWYNTGIDRTTDTGIYIVQAYLDTYNTAQSYQMRYTGLFGMPGQYTNSGDASIITLHRAGHAPNAETLQLRTLLTPNADGKIYLQWLSNFALTLDNTAGRTLQIYLFRLASGV